MEQKLETQIGAYPVIIIGAGPAGLSTARGLKDRNIPFIILERGTQVAESWWNMPTNLRMISIWMANTLPGDSCSILDFYRRHRREEYAQYLRKYAEKNQFNIEKNCTVVSITRYPEGGFCVKSNKQIYNANIVVNATGYFSSPFIPDYFGAKDSTIPQVHVAEFGDAEDIQRIAGKENVKVLIVGKRISAG